MVIFSVICTISLSIVIGVYLAVDAATGYQTAETMRPIINETYDKNWEKDPLLPIDTVPYSYDLYLNPDLENGTFSGTVKIKISLSNPRNYLLVHIDDLNVSKTELFNENNTEIEIENPFYYKTNQFWVIPLREELLPGRYEIKMDFDGLLTGKIVGFYRSTYTADDGTKRHIVTTKFEPTYARKAFPCFDEPRYKAEFTVHIVRPSGNNYFALSNMNQVKEESHTPSPGLTKVSFAPTPPMSTYLACFIVCDFEHLEPVYTSQGTPITVYSRPGTKHKTAFARNIAQKVMNHFIQYFGIEYPLPKIDLIAIPDFVSGAMENWGLITFRETRILTTPEDSVSDREGTANTVAHELAHMWFGDLVTMEWWDDLWLNEGFATFLAPQVVDIVEKDLFSRMDFLIGSLHPVLEEDAREASHPIIQPVNHPDQITEIFDAISYGKGSSVLRMFESYNPIAFQTAVSKYLKLYMFKNAMTVNLWAELGKEYDIPNMTRILNTWTLQKGFPLVSVKREGDTLKLTQQRFLAIASSSFNASDSPFGYKWDIPIMYITSSNPKDIKKAIYKLDDNESSIGLDKGTEWFKLNSNQFGFYRVNYTEDVWLSFLNLLSSQSLDVPEDRTNILDDAFALAKGGYLNFEIPFTLASYLKSGIEKHYAPWIIVSKNLNRYKNILHGTPAYEKLMKYGSELLSNSISNDIWEDSESSSNVEKLYKSTLLAFACRMEIPEVIAKANEIFVNWIEGKTEKPNTSIRGLIYKYGVRGSNEAINRQKLWKLYLNESDPIEKSNFMSAIASVSNPELIAQLLELMKDENNVRSQDYFIFMHYMCLTPEGGEFIWKYIRGNWGYLVKRFTLNDRSLGRVLPNAVSYFSTEEKLAEIEEFIKTNPEAGAGAAGRRKALETVKGNIKWRKQYYENIESALNALVK